MRGIAMNANQKKVQLVLDLFTKLNLGNNVYRSFPEMRNAIVYVDGVAIPKTYGDLSLLDFGDIAAAVDEMGEHAPEFIIAPEHVLTEGGRVIRRDLRARQISRCVAIGPFGAKAGSLSALTKHWDVDDKTVRRVFTL